MADIGNQNRKADHSASLMISASVLLMTVSVGCGITPPETYNRAFGGDLGLLFLFAIAGGVAALVAYLLSLFVLNSRLLGRLTDVQRALLAIGFAAALCAGTLYLGVEIMVHNPIQPTPGFP